jgi:hypothetical protein
VTPTLGRQPAGLRGPQASLRVPMSCCPQHDSIPSAAHCPGPRPRASYRVAFRPDRERRLRAATAAAAAVFELFLRRRR